MNFGFKGFMTFLARLLSVACLLVSLPVLANDGGGSAAPEPQVFTVNVGEGKYLQFGVVFETATPEAGHELALYKPKIRHAIILMLSGVDVEELRSLKGKKALAGEIIETANHVIHETEKTGVKEALFTSFIIQ
jgi:flagellar FliL protein